MSLSLHFNEEFGEILNGLRKVSNCAPVGASILGIAVLERAIGLPPRLLISVSASCADQHVRAAGSERVEHRIVRGAHSAAKFGLRRSSYSGADSS